MATEKLKAALQHELAAHADRGAGLAELLDHLHGGNSRLARRNRLSEDQLDELSLYCWSLQRKEPAPAPAPDPAPVPAFQPAPAPAPAPSDDAYAGHADELWGGYRAVTSTVRARSPRRRGTELTCP
jgi:hypothetical protein